MLGQRLVGVSVLALGIFWGSAADAQSNTQKVASASQRYDKLPLSFEVNQGQADSRVRYLARGSGYDVYLTDEEAIVAFATSEKQRTRERNAETDPPDVLRIQFTGARTGVPLAGEDSLPGKVNYFLGDDPSKWHPNVATFEAVKYSGVYPGLDLVYHGNRGALEFDFHVAAYASPSPIGMRILGAARSQLDERGNLIFSTRDRHFVLRAPAAYQDIAGVRTNVRVGFLINDNDTVGFTVGNYDHSRELTIDPTLVYSTYLGGSGFDAINTMAVDPAGNVYVAGQAYSCDFPTTPGSFQPTIPGCVLEIGAPVVFITKLNPSGNALVYSTFMGGIGVAARASTIAVDPSGDAFVAGLAGAGFPTTPSAFQPVNNAASVSGSNPFVVKLNATGSALVYSTYIGGSSGLDVPYGITLDSSGNAYLGGAAGSVDFPTTPGTFQPSDPTPGLPASFVSKLNANGTALIFSTYLTGTGKMSPDTVPVGQVNGIAAEASGNVYVAGSTSDEQFPVTSGAFQPNYTTLPSDAALFRYTGYVAKFNPTGSKLIYASYLGGSYISQNQALAIDSAGNAYVTGGTTGDFNVTSGAFQTVGPGLDAFVSKVNPTGTALVYSTYLGGSCQASGQLTGDTGFAIAVDASGDAYVSGQTCSPDFPITTGAIQSMNKNGFSFFDAFFTEVNPSGNALLYSTYLGGSGDLDTVGDWANGIGLDAQGNVYVAGLTHSTEFPTTTGALQTKTSSTGAGFISKIEVPQGATLVARDFSLSISPASLTVPSGQSGTVTLTLTPQNGFYQNIQLSCTGVPLSASCEFSSPSVYLDNSAATVTLTYQTDAGSAANHERDLNPLAPAALCAFAFLWFGTGRKRAVLGLVLVLAALGAILPLSACGGGSGGGTSTKGQPYSISVTATAASVTHSSALTITSN